MGLWRALLGSGGHRRRSAGSAGSGNSGGNTNDSGCISAIALAIPPADSGGNLIRPRGVLAVPRIIPAGSGGTPAAPAVLRQLRWYSGGTFILPRGVAAVLQIIPAVLQQYSDGTPAGSGGTPAGFGGLQRYFPLCNFVLGLGA